MYDVDIQIERAESSTTTTLTSKKEINVHLLRRRTLMLGRSPFEDGLSRRTLELDAPVAMQMDDCDEDPLLSIYSGQDFALLTTASGKVLTSYTIFVRVYLPVIGIVVLCQHLYFKVYYTGKGQSLGYKAASPQTGRWTLMKETIFSRNEAPNVKRCKVIQVSIFHNILLGLLYKNHSLLEFGIRILHIFEP